jgi:hypothetical protein
MSNTGPHVHDLSKQEEEENMTHVGQQDYPDALEDDSPETDGDKYDFDVETEVTEYDKDAEMTEKLALSFKVDDAGSFTEVELGDTVLFDTPIEGAKAGEVVGMDETWSGIMAATVDTGVTEYDITPMRDEFSAEYVGTVLDTVDLTENVLAELESGRIDTIDVGDMVVLDCPHIGPTMARTVDVKETTNQGKRATFKTEGVFFVSYEMPSPVQTKEQPYIIGCLRE